MSRSAALSRVMGTTEGPGAVAVAAEMSARAEDIRKQAVPTSRRDLGQFFTPLEVAALVVAQIRLPASGTLRVLDPGAGTGSLCAALIARVLRERPRLGVDITAIEVDDLLVDPLRRTLQECETAAATLGCRMGFTIVRDDFVPWAASRLPGARRLLPDRSTDGAESFDVVIQNPPYSKARRGSATMRLLADAGLSAPNTYAAFLALAAGLLADGGQLAAITPRSFTNGAYFKQFRHRFLRQVGIDRLLVFHDRGSLFADSSVLQENLIIAATKGAVPAEVVVSAARDSSDPPIVRTVPYAQIVHPGDPEAFIHIPADEAGCRAATRVASLPGTLAELGLQVATGRVVDFRVRDALRDRPGPGTIPLIYPGHLRSGGVRWPIDGFRKPNALALDAVTRRLALPSGNYVLVKRFSAKEEPRRVVAGVFHPGDAPAEFVGFENHLNVFHSGGRGLDPRIATGLALWLDSTTLDAHFRQFSGHTQVNATDLRNLRYPSARQLCTLADALGDRRWPDQAEVDTLVDAHIR